MTLTDCRRFPMTGWSLMLMLLVAMVAAACGGGAGTACNRLGELYRDGVGVEADPERANGYFQSACNAGYSQACGVATP